MGDCANVSRAGGGDAPRNFAGGALHGERCVALMYRDVVSTPVFRVI